MSNLPWNTIYMATFIISMISVNSFFFESPLKMNMKKSKSSYKTQWKW